MAIPTAFRLMYIHSRVCTLRYVFLLGEPRLIDSNRLHKVFDGSMPWSDLTDGAVIMHVCVHKKHLPCPRYLSETDLWWDLMVQCWAHEPSSRPTLQYLMESLHATDDTLTSVIKWDKSILTRLRDPLVQGKLVIPSGLPSFLNVEGVSYLSDPDPISVIGF